MQEMDLNKDGKLSPQEFAMVIALYLLALSNIVIVKYLTCGFIFVLFLFVV